MEHDADRAAPPLGEGLPGLGERAERKVMCDQAGDIDLAFGEQRERATGDSLWVRERAQDVEVAAHDGRETDAGKLDPRAGRPTEDHASSPACPPVRIA